MELNRLRIIFVLLATIIVCVMGFIDHYSLTRLSITLVITVFIFFVLGTLLQKWFNRNVRKQQEKTIEQPEEETEKMEEANEE